MEATRKATGRQGEGKGWREGREGSEEKVGGEGGSREKMKEDKCMCVDSRHACVCVVGGSSAIVFTLYCGNPRVDSQ